MYLLKLMGLEFYASHRHKEKEKETKGKKNRKIGQISNYKQGVQNVKWLKRKDNADESEN